LEVDSDRERDLLIAGDRAQREARAAAVEEPAQRGDAGGRDRG